MSHTDSTPRRSQQFFGGDDMRGIVIAVAGQIGDRYFGIRDGCANQRLDFGSGHRHQAAPTI